MNAAPSTWLPKKGKLSVLGALPVLLIGSACVRSGNGTDWASLRAVTPFGSVGVAGRSNLPAPAPENKPKVEEKPSRADLDLGLDSPNNNTKTNP